MNIKENVNKINWNYIIAIIFIVVVALALCYYFKPKGITYTIEDDLYDVEGYNGNGNGNSNGNSNGNGNGNGETKYSLPDAEVILYYATWCGYSKMFLPEWEKFEGYAKTNIPNVKVSSVRCEGGDEATCSQKGVEGYPTIIMYLKDGREITFDGERSSQGLIGFTKKNLNNTRSG